MSAPPDSGNPTPAQIAKAALRRLALSRQEPTPENYAQAWAEETGGPSMHWPARARPVLDKLAQRASDAQGREALHHALTQGDWDAAARLLERGGESAAAQGQAWAQVIERLVRGLERGGKQWTLARKKDSLQRVLDSSRQDVQRLSQRLRQLAQSWDEDSDPAQLEAAAADAATPEAAPAPAAVGAPSPASADAAASSGGPASGHWPAVVGPLQATVRHALPPDHPRAQGLADELALLADRLALEGATPALGQAVAEVCERAGRLLSHRHHLLTQVHRLSQELAGSLADLSEDDSWVQGQLQSLQAHLAEAPNARDVQAAQVMLGETRQRQRGLRQERDQARQALKQMIHRMLHELGELDQHTGRFSDGMQRYAETIARADSLESLADVVREMVEEGQAVHGLVSSARARLHDEHGRALALEEQVRALEAELRRLSDEVATDALTQIANRRGLLSAFEREQARVAREASPLAIGLLDIDNFKRLNDSLGHAAGDEALVALAHHVRDALRPGDLVARFGGEEFVVLLPDTAVDEAQRILTRLQRLLSASLFMHEGQEVFVTFSAGVTAYRPDEAIAQALERADEALYEAKGAGKNRTCIA